METGKLNKDVYKDVDAAYKAFGKFCAKFDYCSECPLNDKHPNCGVNFLYQAAPRRGRPLVKNENCGIAFMFTAVEGSAK